MILTVTVARNELKACFVENENKPFVPTESHLLDGTCLNAAMRFLGAIWFSDTTTIPENQTN